MPCAVFFLALLPFGKWAITLPLIGMQYGVEIILDVSHWVADLGGAVVHVPVLSTFALCFIILAVIWLIILRGAMRFFCVLLLLPVPFIGLFAPQPDILVSGNQKLWGVQPGLGNPLWLSSLRGNRFDAENWRQRLGQEDIAPISWPKNGTLYAGEGSGTSLQCDYDACRLQKDTHAISFVKNTYALRTECVWADIVISRNAVKDFDCDAELIIDRFDAWQHGAHAVFLRDHGGILIETVDQSQGVRPWVISNAKAGFDRDQAAKSQRSNTPSPQWDDQYWRSRETSLP